MISTLKGVVFQFLIFRNVAFINFPDTTLILTNDQIYSIADGFTFCKGQQNYSLDQGSPSKPGSSEKEEDGKKG